MIRLILFDIDGTLIATGGAGERAFADVCRAEFGVLNGTLRLHFAGRTDPSIVRDFFAHHEIAPSPENFQRFFDRYVFHLEHVLGKLNGRVLPGVLTWLAGLGARTSPPLLGLLTGNISLGARIKLGHFGLWDRFETGAFGDDHEDRNEIARIARVRARLRLGDELRDDEILVIGDTPRDIECARAIGAKVLAVATGSYTADELRAHRPEWAVRTLEQISPADVCG
jgi:phosphoglycolate phosphatase-like HAD superfamily hydrolase